MGATYEIVQYPFNSYYCIRERVKSLVKSIAIAFQFLLLYSSSRCLVGELGGY